MIHVFVFGNLPPVCDLDLSYIQRYFWVIITKNTVGGHVGRDARAESVSQPPFPGQDLSVQGYRGLSVT